MSERPRNLTVGEDIASMEGHPNVWVQNKKRSTLHSGIMCKGDKQVYG